MGRRALPAEDRRSVRVVAYVTPGEAAALRQVGPESDAVRHLIHEVLDPQSGPGCDCHLCREPR